MRKEKLRKVGLCFKTGCFIKPLNMISNHFFHFSSSFAAQSWLFDKRGNWERQIARNGKLNICFKNNFNLLVMSVLQLNFFTEKMYIYDTLLMLIIREVCCSL